MKLKTPKRPNFSRSAKLCDQTFYHDSQPVHHLDNDTSPLNKPLTQRKSSTYGFSSVSREKKSNFRFPIRLPVGEFTYYPNHSYGRNKEPTWSFNKTQRYEKIPIIEYEVCERHPALQEDQQAKLRASATSMKEFMKDKIRANRSSSYFSLKDKSTSQLSKDTRYSRNYSIIQPQQTSQVGFYTKTKIQHPLYLSKQDLNQLEGQLDEKHYQQRLQPCSNGYIQFSKRRSRQPNRNSKGFETFLYSNTDQNQFNNYHQTQFPCGPIGHIQMQKHLNRPDYMPDRLGPNTEPFSIDGVRVNQNHIDLHLQKFRDKVTTRYDRVGPQPKTRLDYDVKPKELPPMLQMDRMLGRNAELFPIVDPAIKKGGDAEMKQQLKRCIPFKEINEAHRPKNVQNFSKLVRQGL